MGKAKLWTLQHLHDGSEAESVLTQPSDFQMEGKSKKCNPCATQFSSYMHFEQVGAIVGVRACNFTNRACQEKKPNLKSSIDGILLPHSLNCVCECAQHMSSEASNIVSVSSHESFSDIAESQAIVRVYDPCEYSRKARSAGESSDTPEGSIKFDNDKFSNQLEKHKGLDILVDNVSCIRGSDSTYLTIDVNENHHDIQNFIEIPPLKGVVYPSFFNCAIPQKGEYFECSGEQVGSTPARIAKFGFRENCLYFKRHFQKCPVIENTSMKGQSHPVDIMDSSNLMEEEVRVCDVCGDVGLEELLAICSICTDGAEHIYCMRIKLDKVPEGDWTCEECIVRTDTKKPEQDKVKVTTGKWIGHPQCQRFRSSVNIESRGSSKIKSRPSCAGGKATNDVISLLPAKRHGALSQAQSIKKAKTTGVRFVLPRSSKPCNNSLLHRNTSFKNLKKEWKETKEMTSVLQLSCNASEKAKVPHACGNKRRVEILKAESDRQTRDLETEVISPKKSSTNKSLLQKDTSFYLKKGQMKAFKQTNSEPQTSCNAWEKAEALSASGDESHVELSKDEFNKVKRDLKSKVKTPNAPKTIKNPALHSDPSYKDLKNGRMKPSEEITCMVQISCNAQRKANNPSVSGDDKRRDIVKSVTSSKASHPTNRFILRREASLENLEKKKVVIVQNVSSLKKSSYGTREKAQLSSVLGDKSLKSCSQSEILEDECSLLKSGSLNTADLKLKGQLPKGSLLKSRSFNAADLKLKRELTKGYSLQKRTVVKDPNFQDKKDQKDPGLFSKSLSFNHVSVDKLNTPSSEVFLPNADHSEVLKRLDHSKETQMIKGKSVSKLQNSTMGSEVFDPGVTTLKSEKESLPYHDDYISESNSHKLDSVECCELLNNSLDPSSGNTIKPASDKGSHRRNLPQFDAALFSRGFVIPEPDYIWLGKFQLYSGEGLESSCDGIQAHLSTFASPKVLEAVDKIPEIIILEQLPRLRTWPSQFVERQATEENIALYFFATDLDSYRTHYSRLLTCMTKNDLALRGDLDGVELLIFPSNLLPEENQRWNNLLFLWGVLRGRKFGNSVALSNSLKVSALEKNRHSEKTVSLDLNAYPQDGEDTEGVDEGAKCRSVNNSPGAKSLADRIFVGGDGDSSGLTAVMQDNDRGEIKSHDVDLDLSLWPKSDGVGGDRNNEEVHEEATMEDVEASLSGSHGQNLETEEGKNELLPEWQAADTLMLLSKRFGKI